MNRRSLLTTLATLPTLTFLPAQAAAPTKIQVHKDPNCGCCTGWVDHLNAAGFSVDVTESADMAPVRKRLGMPERLASCHTGVVEGYALEGHVPAAEVKRLLSLRPQQAVGLAVPGMPVGSPGMEVAGGRVDAYKVLLVDRSGRDTVFASYPASTSR